MEWSVDLSEPTLTNNENANKTIRFSDFCVLQFNQRHRTTTTKKSIQEKLNLIKKQWSLSFSLGNIPIPLPLQLRESWGGHEMPAALVLQPTENTELFGAPVKAPAPGDRQSFDKINNSLENPPAQVVSIWFDLMLRSGEESPIPRASMRTIAIY